MRPSTREARGDALRDGALTSSWRLASAIGGNIGTNAGGLDRRGHGVTADHVLGLEAVFGDGSIARAQGHRTAARCARPCAAARACSRSRPGVPVGLLVLLERRRWPLSSPGLRAPPAGRPVRRAICAPGTGARSLRTYIHKIPCRECSITLRLACSSIECRGRLSDPGRGVRARTSIRSTAVAVRERRGGRAAGGARRAVMRKIETAWYVVPLRRLRARQTEWTRLVDGRTSAMTRE